MLIYAGLSAFLFNQNNYWSVNNLTVPDGEAYDDIDLFGEETDDDIFVLSEEIIDALNRSFSGVYMVCGRCNCRFAIPMKSIEEFVEDMEYILCPVCGVPGSTTLTVDKFITKEEIVNLSGIEYALKEGIAVVVPWR